MAKKEYRKGKASGGILMGIRKEIMEKGSRIKIKRERILVRRVKIGSQRWRVVVQNTCKKKHGRNVAKYSVESRGKGIRSIY